MFTISVELIQACPSLTIYQKDLLTQRYVYRKKVVEIAAHFSKSIGTVSPQISRALEPFESWCKLNKEEGSKTVEESRRNGKEVAADNHQLKKLRLIDEKDESLISTLTREKRELVRPIEAERIDRLLYYESFVTGVGRHAPGIFADTVKINEEDRKGDTKSVAARVVEQYLSQMRLEHESFLRFLNVRRIIHVEEKVECSAMEGMYAHNLRENFISDFLPMVERTYERRNELIIINFDRGFWYGWNGAFAFNRRVHEEVVKELPGFTIVYGRCLERLATHEEIERTVIEPAIEPKPLDPAIVKELMPQNPFTKMRAEILDSMKQ